MEQRRFWQRKRTQGTQDVLAKRTEDLANKEVVVAPETKVGQLINRSTWPDFSCCSEDIFICFILTSSLAPCILKLDTMSSVHPAWTSMPQKTFTSEIPSRGCEVSMISLEISSRLATVTSEENEGSSMTEGSAGPTSGPLAENAPDLPLFPASFVGVCQHGVRPHHLPRLFSRFCTRPLNPAALAFVPFGIVLQSLSSSSNSIKHSTPPS